MADDWSKKQYLCVGHRKGVMCLATKEAWREDYGLVWNYSFEAASSLQFRQEDHFLGSGLESTCSNPQARRSIFPLNMLLHGFQSLSHSLVWEPYNYLVIWGKGLQHSKQAEWPQCSDNCNSHIERHPITDLSWWDRVLEDVGHKKWVMCSDSSLWMQILDSSVLEHWWLALRWSWVQTSLVWVWGQSCSQCQRNWIHEYESS